VEIRRRRLGTIIKISIFYYSGNGTDLRTPYFGIKTVDKRRNPIVWSQAQK